MDKTTLFDVATFKSEVITKTLKEVYKSLEERGYNPINQIVGYIISGDPGYISNYENARSKILELDRSELVALLLKNTLEK
ncbi:MAG: IreB family regulatory phosphoprotein [Bacilli bacterium]|jgi:UPF0297 protein CA_C1679|nr:IreB family regulatory phosphoprotein [Bacilli bacterium]